MTTAKTQIGPAQPIEFGKYVLVERLGRGGMAEVWKAKMVGPARFERTMVVKRILPHLAEDAEFVEMFVSEARLSARLNHANIVSVFELGLFDGEYFLAMEYVRGMDLISVLRRHAPQGPLPPGFAAFVLREVASALAYAHSLTDDNGVPLGLIHRDVSPSNVMIRFDGGVKLLDFGIAKALSEVGDTKTRDGTLKGKLGYMSPEQIQGKELDARSDLFSAGILLHEALAGRRLFKGTHEAQTLELVLQARVEPPSRFNPAVPPDLDRICLKALARDPRDRYQTGDELAADLDQIANQLDWGPVRLVALMKSLFPAERTRTFTGPTESLAPDLVLPRGSGGHQRPRRRHLLALAATAALIAGAGAGALVQHRFADRASDGASPAAPAVAATAGPTARSGMAPGPAAPSEPPPPASDPRLPADAPLARESADAPREDSSTAAADWEARAAVRDGMPSRDADAIAARRPAPPARRGHLSRAPMPPVAKPKAVKVGPPASLRVAAPALDATAAAGSDAARPKSSAPTREAPKNDLLKGDFVDPFAGGAP